MVRVSNGFVALVNILALLASVAAIGGSAWFYVHQGSICQKFLQQPLLIVGASLFVVSLLGLLGSCCRVQFLLWIYLFVMFLLIIGLMFSTVFTIVVTNKGVGQAVSGKGFKEYRLGDYSDWLQNYVVNARNWDGIRSCLVDSRICSTLGGNPDETVADFSKRNLSPIQSGCCKPPTYCDFQFQNATFWRIPKMGPAAPDKDCTAWSNNQAALCYDCNACKAGVLANIKREWRRLAILNVGVLVLVIVVYSVGCCALSNNRSARHRRHKGYPPYP